MAGNRKKSTAEQLEELKAKYAAQEQQLQAQKEELARLKFKTAKLKLIPRPKGQAGRGKNGYNLQKEMKLQNDSARFQRIERITWAYANWYLPTGKTIKEQDKTTLEKLIRLLQKDIKYFQRFQGGWSIYAIVKQYLRNCNEKLRRDVRLERAAEAADGTEFTDADGDGEAPDVGDGDASDEDVDVEGSDVEMEQAGTCGENSDEDWDENIQREDSTEDDFVDDSATQLQAASWDNAVMNEAVDTPQGRKGSAKENFVPASEDISVTKKVKRAKNIVLDSPTGSLSPSPSPSKKRKVLEGASYSNVLKKLKLSENTDSNHVLFPNNLRMSVNPTSDSSRAPLPRVCPAPHCRDSIPIHPRPNLVTLLKKYELLSDNQAQTSEARELTRNLCGLIKNENKRLECWNEARLNGWIVDVDFAGLRDRIPDSELPAAITELARDQEELEGCPLWSLFLDRISYKVHAFSRTPIGMFASAADQALRCGYYGLKGRAILISIIEESLEQSIDPEQIYQTIATLKDKPEPWDQEDATFSLPSTPQFIYYVLAPFAATVLIAEDLDVDFDIALTIMQQSSDFGDLFNSEVAVVLNPPSKYSLNTETIKSLVPMGTNPAPKKESLKAPPAAKKMPDILPPAVTTAKNAPSKALKNNVVESKSTKITTVTSFPPPVVTKKLSKGDSKAQTTGTTASKKAKPVTQHPVKTHVTRSWSGKP